MPLKQIPVRQRGECCELPVETSPEWAGRTTETLRAVADPTRLRMLACLWKARAPICICDFTAAFDLSQPTISHHMGKLRAAGLVDSRREGIWSYYRLRDDLPGETRQILSAILAASPHLLSAV